MVIVHNKASLEPAEELIILLQNWTFIAILFSELKNMISSDCIHRVQHRSSRTQSWTLLKPQRGCFSLTRKTYPNPPVNNQNNHVWAVGKKCEDRLVVQRAKFASCTRYGLGWRLLHRQRTIALHTGEGQGECKTLHWYWQGRVTTKVVVIGERARLWALVHHLSS